MQLVDVLTPDRIIFSHDVKSKKKALELASQLAVKTLSEIEENDVFDHLLAREKLGSTGIGHGVAIPHCRIPDLHQTMAILLRLHSGIDFDAVDKQPVDIVLTLLVPEDSNDEHLQLLANIAKKFSDTQFREKLRNATEPQILYKIATEYDDD